MSGPNPISFAEIRDWVELTGNVVTAGEIETLRAMDGAFIAALAKEQAEAEERVKES